MGIPYPVFPVNCGTGILSMSVFQYGHPNSSSYPNNSHFFNLTTPYLP